MATGPHMLASLASQQECCDTDARGDQTESELKSDEVESQ